jgi:CubicO group peptidase (beta-lactamase class C family)
MSPIDERLLWHEGEPVEESKFNRAFGRVLAQLRGSDDFNPTRTAQHSGVDRAFLYALEKGEKGVSLFTLFRIASASKQSASSIVHLLEQELSKGAEERK